MISLFFCAVIALVTLPVAVYAMGYFRHEYRGPKRRLAWILFVAFVATMLGVVTVANAFVFLILWELMSLVSYFFVVFDSGSERSARAGVIYLVMTHIGTAFLTAAFLLMYRYAHSFDFAAFHAACSGISSPVKNLLFVFLLVGFGAKAGIVPLHIWLPYAHPEAPSPVSSLMSGVMIKTAIYGMIRFILCILGIDAAWWGFLILVLALIACLVGVIYALMEHDLKKLLAYHSIENIGIILLGVGLCFLFVYLGRPYLAVLSLAAGLYHLANHAIFKALLFLCAGSVWISTGTRDIEKMGGLIKRMPQTALFFLVGAMGISALPPFNGFVSEWLTLQAFFQGAFLVTGPTKIFLGIAAALLALTGGLAAACFVKAFGVSFLAAPRSRQAQEAGEAGFSMKAGMGFLALATIVFGVAAAWIWPLLVKTAASTLALDISGISFSLSRFMSLPRAQGAISLDPMSLACVLFGFGVLAFAVARIPARRAARIYQTWGCGYYREEPRHEYTATGFSKPFRIAFAFFLLPYRRTQKIRESFYHVKSFKYETHTTMIFRKFIYEPALGVILRSAKFMRRIQPGSIHVYLAYIFVTALLLILARHKF